ncbi:MULTISPECIES: FHA domain-containing protein [Nitrincola]|uniref:FHA domain protein n=1 Tax=Nitrincola nitratireducens TaxID=1229521 RepID=W9UWH8_9GAMM|nr:MULTISPECIES: FHA domain-containing protein [Nitrincola]EXJ09086.1 FHA domain protein [Nitrincola nitratireducens]
MTVKIDVTRRLAEENNKSMDDVETHKMGDKQNQVNSFTEKTDYIDDRGKNTNINNAPTEKTNETDEVTRIFRPNAGVATENMNTTATDYMTDPVVGWVVVVDGPGKGSALPLGYGMNTIGRANCRVNLNFGDLDISREPHASITYDPRGRAFYVNHGGGKNLTYMNDAPVLQPLILNGGEVINLGLTALKFVPFCCKEFDWQDLK